MAAILAREYPDLFAAAGVHSGVAAGAAHDVASAFSVMKTARRQRRPGRALARQLAAAPRREGRRARAPAPVIVFHGDADATVARRQRRRGHRRRARGVDAVAEKVVARRRAGASARSRAPSGAAPARAPTRRRLAEHWVVEGAPHAWSGGASAGSYTDPQGPDASREMLRFFLAHPRRRA